VLPYFGVFMMLWASFMLTFWRQKQAALAYRWGTLHFEVRRRNRRIVEASLDAKFLSCLPSLLLQVEETERPQFKAKEVFDPTTGEKKKVFGFSERAMRYAVSLPILAGLIVLVLYFMIGIFATRDELLEHYLDDQESNMSALQVLKSIFSGWSASLIRSTSITASATGSSDGSNTNAADGSGADSSGIGLEESRWNDPYFWLVTLFYPSLYGVVLPIFAWLFTR